MREPCIELSRQPHRSRLEVLLRADLLEAAQFAKPLVLQDRQ
jgi:hypothetical protein